MPSMGIIYNNEIRNNGTAVYCWRALEQLGVNVWHYLPTGQPSRQNAPDCLAHDYYLYIDDGRDDLGVPDLSKLPGPCSYWAIDTHLGLGHRVAMAKQMEHVFCVHKSGPDLMKAEGIKSATWLPVACHPEAHLSFPIEDKSYDLAFVGFLNSDWDNCPPGHHNRVQWLDMLFKKFPNSRLATNLFFEHMALEFSKAKIGFNISVKDDLNMRFFEIMSTGTCLLTNTDAVGWKELGFVEGDDFIGYTTEEDCIEKATEILADDDYRKTVARLGYDKVRAGHTYWHRMKTILDKIGFPCPLEPDMISSRYNEVA